MDVHSLVQRSERGLIRNPFTGYPMKKHFFVSGLIAVFLFVNGYAEEKITIEAVNEFGGETITTKYSAGDGEFKLEKKTEYFNKNGIRKKAVGYRLINQYNKLKIDRAVELYSDEGVLQSTEILIRPEKAREIGYNRVITYFGSLEVITRREIYYNESDFDVKIYQKAIEYFSETGEKIRSVTYLTEQEAKKTGYYKLVTTFSNGEIVKQVLFDKQGVAF
jgi:hypothetical protein